MKRIIYGLPFMILADTGCVRRILQKAASLNVIVIGDGMLDHYVWGDVYRISPEAPIPVVQIAHETYRLGGACNVALNLSTWGANVTFLGVIGQDAAGQKLRVLLQDGRIACPEENFRPDASSIVKTRVIARQQQLCRLDREKIFSEKQVAYIENFLVKALSSSRIDAVIVSDYNKGTVTQALLDHLIVFKRQYKFFLSVDPKPAHGLNYKDADLLKPNRNEALQMSNRVDYKMDRSFTLKTVAEAIFKKYAVRYLAITLGEDGLAILDKTLKMHLIPTSKSEVFDVSGAGDTALAALTAAFCAHALPSEAACFANIASGVVVGKIGTSTATSAEILAYMS